MARLLSTSIKVLSASVAVCTQVAPAATTKVRISLPVNGRVYVGPSPSTAFTATISALFGTNPVNNAHFQFGPPSALVDYQWKSSAPTGNQVLIGANLSASIDNLVTKLNSNGFQASNISSGGTYGIGIYIPSTKGVGPAMDEWQIYGESYMTYPAPTKTGYAYDAGGDFVGAGRDITLDCSPGWGVAVFGEDGIVNSLPSNGEGGSVSFWS